MNLSNLVLDKVRSFATTGEAAEFFSTEPEKIVSWLSGAPLPIWALEKLWPSLKFPAPVASVETRKVVVMMASYKTTMPQTTFSLLTMLDKTRMACMLDFGDAFIAHSRNKLAENYLRTKSEWALMTDDDMIFPCGNAEVFNTFSGLNLPERFAGVHLVDRLLSHNKTLIGGLYYGRWEKSFGVFAEGRSMHEYIMRAPRDEIRPTRWVGTGSMLIHRSVFEDIEKKFPFLGRNDEGKKCNFFTSSEHDLRNGAEQALEILNDGAVSAEARVAHVTKILEDVKAQTAAYSRLGTGEDVIFCHRAAQAGHQPYVDLGCISGHIGTKVFGPRY